MLIQDKIRIRISNRQLVTQFQVANSDADSKQSLYGFSMLIVDSKAFALFQKQLVTVLNANSQFI